MDLRKLITKLKSKLSLLFNKFGVYSKTAVKITEGIKIFVESKFVGDFVTATPIVWDDLALTALRLHVPKVAMKLALIYKITEAASGEDPLEVILAYLKTIDKEERVDFWIRFSAELTSALADDKLTLSESLILAQLAFGELYEKK